MLLSDFRNPLNTTGTAYIPFHEDDYYNMLKKDSLNAQRILKILLRYALTDSSDIMDNSGYMGSSMHFKSSLLVGNPKYTKETEWSFMNLPGAEKEVQTINSLIKSNDKIYTGDSATKTTIYNILVSPQSSNLELIYFATHGISSPINPLENSFLVLAGNGNESFLTAKEIQNIPLEKYKLKWPEENRTPEKPGEPLQVDLVIMSACQSGLGGTHIGGTIGLARAWQIAGANNVVMSLWNVDDEVTMKLMVKFFENLGDPRPFQPASSLQDAIIEIKKIYPDYKYWASFSIFGIPAR